MGRSISYKHLNEKGDEVLLRKQGLNSSLFIIEHGTHCELQNASYACRPSTRDSRLPRTV